MDYPRGHTDDRYPVRHVLSHDGTGTDDGAFTDGDSAEDGGGGADGGAAMDFSRHDLPVGLSLEGTVGVSGGGKLVVDKRNIVADKNLVPDLDPFAYEGVAGDLAVSADLGTPLDFNETADF